MQVKFKKLHPDAVTPSYAKEGDAGADITAVGGPVFTADYIQYHTGLAVEIPPGFVGLIYPRSSISKKSLSLSNAVGIIDENFRGEILFRFKNSYVEHGRTSEYYEKGDRIGQLIIMPYPKLEFTEVEELTPTIRGEGGFGSSGA